MALNFDKYFDLAIIIESQNWLRIQLVCASDYGKSIKLQTLNTILATKCEIKKITLKKMDSTVIYTLRNAGHLSQNTKYRYRQLNNCIKLGKTIINYGGLNKN